MSNVYNTGPVAAYVGWGGNPYAAKNKQSFKTSIYPLGWSESGINVEQRQQYEPINADPSGSMVPHDLLFQSEMAFVSGDFSRWNESIVRLLQSRPFTTGAIPGAYRSAEMGTPMLFENLAPQLYLVFGSRFNPAQNAGVNAIGDGLRFFAAVPVGPETRSLGSRANKIRLVWQSLPVFDENKGTLHLFDQNVKAAANVSMVL